MTTLPIRLNRREEITKNLPYLKLVLPSPRDENKVTGYPKHSGEDEPPHPDCADCQWQLLIMISRIEISLGALQDCLADFRKGRVISVYGTFGLCIDPFALFLLAVGDRTNPGPMHSLYSHGVIWGMVVLPSDTWPLIVGRILRWRAKQQAWRERIKELHKL